MPFYYDFTQTHDNRFLRWVRKVYKPLGFQKGYNFPLWVIFGGAMLGFGLARLSYFNVDGDFKQQHIVNGDWEYWQSGHYRIGIILHLVGVLPACLLVPWQFLPRIRAKAMLLHRMNGYLCILLFLVAVAGAFMIINHQMGGLLSSQVLVGILGIYTTVSIFMAYYNIKRLQIDQHRAWMLRTWFAAGSVISERIVALAVSYMIQQYYAGTFYMAMPCHTIDYILSNYLGQPGLAAQLYPACAVDTPDPWAAVELNDSGTPEQIGAMLSGTFGIAGFIALFLHIVGCEIYLHLTTAEQYRLKQVSYERQLARGMQRPGNAGITSETWGDCREWHAKEDSEVKDAEMVSTSDEESQK